MNLRRKRTIIEVTFIADSMGLLAVVSIILVLQMN